MAEGPERTRADTVFFSILLWACAGAALWLFVHSSAWEGRDLARRLESETLAMQREQALNDRLHRWRNGLEGDTSVIEREARNLGYGRIGEKGFALSFTELRSARESASFGVREARFPWTSALGESALPAVALLIISILAVLFFTDLKIEEPSAPQGGTLAGGTHPGDENVQQGPARET